MNRISNALINARRAKECKNYREAKRYYDMVKMETPENWEATFYSTYCDVIEKDISQAAKSISNCIKMVLRDIKKLNDATEQNEAIKQINTDLFDFAASAQIRASNAYSSSIGNYADARNRAYSVVPLGLVKLGEIDESLQQIYGGYILNALDILVLFGNELISEFGKNEFTTTINIKCQETAFKMAPSQYYADKLKQVNPYSHELLKFENRGFFKKFWEKRDPMEKSILGCGGFFIIMAIFAAIWVILTQGPPDPAWNGVTACQRKYCESVMIYPYYSIKGKEGEPMYSNGAGADGRTVYITKEEKIRQCSHNAITNGKCP